MSQIDFMNANPMLKDEEARCQLAYTLLYLEPPYRNIEISLYKREFALPERGMLINPTNYLAEFTSGNKPSYQAFRKCFNEADGMLTAVLGISADDVKRISVGFCPMSMLQGDSGVYCAVHECPISPEKEAEKFVSTWNYAHQRMLFEHKF